MIIAITVNGYNGWKFSVDSQSIFFLKVPTENVQVSHGAFNSALAQNHAVETVFTHTNV